MPIEQEDCCRGLKGCEDRLLISKAILRECRSRKKNVCMVCMDYQKPFDRVHHSWITKSLQLIGISNKIIAFTKKAMSYGIQVCVYIQKGR
jgi:hypothetical protein